MAPPKKTVQKMSLGSFLQDETLGSWADEMEDMPLDPAGSRTGYGGRSVSTAGGGFGSNSFADRGYSVREQLPLPDKPPYTAHLGNLSFDVTEGDIKDYFHDCEVTNVRIVEDKLDHKPKGFGYVEFGTIDGLKKALDLNGSQFSGRNIRISVAEPPKDRPDAREFGDWTRKGPLPDLPGQRRVASERGFAARQFDNSSDAGSERGDRRRQPFGNDDGKQRDFGNWERKGPLQPAAGPPPSRDGGRPRFNGEAQDRRQSPQWSGSQEGSRPPRRDGPEKPHVERAPTAAEMDNQWRSKMKPDAPPKSPVPSRETSTPSSPASSAVPLASAKPAGRPKLNLQKRTVSEADQLQPASAATDGKASPFGAARPIDTTQRDKEIEEKRELAIRLKKEEDEKIKEEKKKQQKEAKDAARAEKIAASKAQENEKGAEGGGQASSGGTFEILRKEANGDEAPSSAAAGDGRKAEIGKEHANGEVVDDKAVKPRETVRNIPAKRTDSNAWRRKANPPIEKKDAPQQQQHQQQQQQSSSTAPAVEPPPTTGEKLEEEGWSTVSNPRGTRKGRGGNQAARAIAS